MPNSRPPIEATSLPPPVDPTADQPFAAGAVPRDDYEPDPKWFARWLWPVAFVLAVVASCLLSLGEGA